MKLEHGQIVLNPLFRFEEDENATAKKVSGSLNYTGNHMEHPDKFLANGIYEFLGENYKS